MSATLTIDLPEDVRATLGKAALEDGVSESTFAVKVLERHLRDHRSSKAAGETANKADIDALLRTMDKLSRSAKRRGLTPEILDSILNGE